MTSLALSVFTARAHRADSPLDAILPNSNPPAIINSGTPADPNSNKGAESSTNVLEQLRQIQQQKEGGNK